MSETKISRRGRGEDAIYFATAKNRYVGSVSLGFGPDGKRIRRKVFGRTKQEVREKLKALHQELNTGVRSSSTYTVREAVDDWLREGLDGTSERTRTLYEGLLEPVLELIGAKPLRVLSAAEVRSALGQLTTRYSTRSLQITRNSLERAIRHAEGNDLVGRNVAALVKTPQGRSGRPSKSFTLDQAKALPRVLSRTLFGNAGRSRGRSTGNVSSVRYRRPCRRPGCSSGGGRGCGGPCRTASWCAGRHDGRRSGRLAGRRQHRAWS